MHAVSELETKQEAGTYDFEVKHTAHLFFANFQSIIVRYLNSIREASSNIDMFAIIAWDSSAEENSQTFLLWRRRGYKIVSSTVRRLEARIWLQ